jgi:two-component system nitrogen regulation response regulator NtrX
MALIILAEDDEQVRSSTRMLIEDDGHECMDFTNGDDALDALRASRHVELMILDIFMPSSDGRDLVTILRNGPPRFRNMPILLISGIIPEQIARLHTDDQKCRFLKKPFTGDLLRKTINSLLDSH